MLEVNTVGYSLKLAKAWHSKLWEARNIVLVVADEKCAMTVRGVSPIRDQPLRLECVLTDAIGMLSDSLLYCDHGFIRKQSVNASDGGVRGGNHSERRALGGNVVQSCAGLMASIS